MALIFVNRHFTLPTSDRPSSACAAYFLGSLSARLPSGPPEGLSLPATSARIPVYSSSAAAPAGADESASGMRHAS